MNDLTQPISDDETHLIAVREQAIRCLEHGYGMDGISDACQEAESLLEGNSVGLDSSYRSLHSLKRKVVEARRAGYGPEEIGDAVAEAEIKHTKRSARHQ